MPVASFITALLAPALLVSPPVKWTFSAHELPNGQVRVDLTATMEAGWHIYATELPSDQGPLPTAITFQAAADHDAVNGILEPEPEKADDPNFGMVLHFHSNTVTFSQVLARKSTGAFSVSGDVEYMACNDRTCLPPVKVPFTLEVPALSAK